MKTNIDFDAYDYYGIRSDDAVYEVGDVMPESREWQDGELTGELLDGTCATEIRQGNLEFALKKHRRENYCGSRTYVLAGNAASYGEDASEIIIRNAVVVGIL